MPSSSLVLKVGTVFSALSSTVYGTTYTIEDRSEGSTFLDNFDFFTQPDPTNGFVRYIDRTPATNANLVRNINGDTYLGVDFTTPLTVNGPGRSSVRIETKKRYNNGLFIVDLKHMPSSTCGTWPAFWSLGAGDAANWPRAGEIDIIEGVNRNANNKMVLHTDTDCKTDGIGQTGRQVLYDCALDSPSGSSGCDVDAVESASYGSGFNAVGGGVYAMEWTDESIKMWFFPRGAIPPSIVNETPDTSLFGIPTANFAGDCDFRRRFVDHKFIFNTAFCGDWAGNVYAQSGCPQYAGLSGMDSCKRFVAQNPSAFSQSYWLITYFKTFKKDEVVSSSSSSSSAMSSTETSTASSTTSDVSSTETSTASTTSDVSNTESSSSTVSTTSEASSTETSTESSTTTSDVSSTETSSTISTTSVSSTETSSTSTEISSTSTEVSLTSTESSTASTSSEVSSSTSSSASSTEDASSTVTSTYDVTISTTTSGVETSTDVTSATSSVVSSSDVISSSTTSHVDTTLVYPTDTTSSEEVYPTETSSSVEYSETSTSCTTSSSSAPADIESSSSIPDYEVSTSDIGEYSTSVQPPAYPTTTCTDSTYPAESETPTEETSNMPYPTASSSAPAYGEAESSLPAGYPSVPADNEYPHGSEGSYPTTAPAVPTHEEHSYVTKTYTTTYVDVCPTGYTTISTQHTVVYEEQEPTAVPTPKEYPPGFTTTVKLCTKGCDSYPTYVTLTVPITETVYETVEVAKPTSEAGYMPTTPETIYPGGADYPETDKPGQPQENQPGNGEEYTPGHEQEYQPGYEQEYQPGYQEEYKPGHGEEYQPTQPGNEQPYVPSSPSAPAYSSASSPAGDKPQVVYVTASQIVTLSVVPVPASEYYASQSAAVPEHIYSSAPAEHYPVKPEGTPGYYHPAPNVTVSYGTGTGVPSVSKTGYEAPEFTGAAGAVRVGGVLGGVMAVVAGFLF